MRKRMNWYESNNEVVRFAESMLDAGMFDSADCGSRGAAYNLLSYFEKPYHWGKEHAWWVVNGWTDDVELWELGFDTGYDQAEEWLLRADEPYNDDEVDGNAFADPEYLYWLVDFGWVGVDDATVFKAGERAATIDGVWVAKEVAE